MPSNVYDVNTPRAYHHGDLRRALVRAASEILEAEGLEALTLRGAARRAGVSAMAPYRHFADRNALLAAVAEGGFARLRARLGAAARPDDRGALVELGVAYVRFAAEHPDLFRLMYGQEPVWARRTDAELAGDPGTVYGFVAERLGRLFRPEEAHLALMASWAFVHGLACLRADRRLSGPAADIDGETRAVAAFFADRLLAPADPTAAIEDRLAPSRVSPAAAPAAREGPE
jgi:AcrR family transcriptional regulator